MASQEDQLPLRLICSDELGLVKVVQTADGAQLGATSVVATWGQPDKSQGVSCLRLGSRGGLQDAETAVLATARTSGAIDILNPCTAEVIGSIPAASPAAQNGSGASSKSDEAAVVCGLHWIWGGAAAGGAGSTPALLSVTQGGAARVHAASADGSSWEELRSWQVPANVCCTAYDPDSCTLAVGCQGTELRLFDAASGELRYAAKGGKPNKLGLVDRPWNTALCFLPDSAWPAPAAAAAGGPAAAGGGSSSSSASGSVILVGTGHHKLRLYDTRAGKRPQLDMSFGETRITTLAPEAGGLRIWVGNGLGQLEVLDLKTRKMSGAIKGIAGSVRCVALHPSRPIVASVGLDRFLRLHDTRTRTPLAKVYLKQQLTGVQFCPVSLDMLPQRPAAEGAAAEEGAGEEEEQQQGQGKGRRHKRSKEGGSRSSGEHKEKKKKRSKKAD